MDADEGKGRKRKIRKKKQKGGEGKSKKSKMKQSASESETELVVSPPLVAAGVGALVVMLVASLVLRGACACDSETPVRFRVQMDTLTTWVAGMLAWPLVWFGLVSPSLLASHPVLGVGLAWPLVMGVVELTSSKPQRGDANHPVATGRGGIQMDLSAVTGIAFAVSGIVGATVGRAHGLRAAPIFSASVLFCLLFLVPAPSVDSDSPRAAVFHAWQRVSLSFCVGLLITGASLHLSHSVKEAKR